MDKKEEVKGKQENKEKREKGEKDKEEKLKETEKIEEEKERKIVVPGEIVAHGFQFLPGDGTRREGPDILAMKFGLLEKNDRLVKIIPLSGAYLPRVGNTVIGRITDMNFNGWFVDILSPQEAFLPVSECFARINKADLAEVFDIGDMIVAKVKSIKSRNIDLTMRDHGLHKLSDGMIVKVNSSRVPRIIGREGSMVKIIKDETNCNITIGQNGVIWIKGNDIDDELLAKEAIEFIVEKPFIEGLTDTIKEFLVKKKEEMKREEKEKLKETEEKKKEK